MYYYFSSAYPAAIKLNGIYYGVISDTVKAIDLDQNLPLVEVCPLCANERQINFFPDGDFLSNPPDNALVTDLGGGYLIKFLKNTKVGDFRVIAQKKGNNLLATVFVENGLKVSIETPGGFFADCLDFIADSAEISSFNLDGNSFCLITFSGVDKMLCVYSLTSEPVQRVFIRQADDYSIDGGFFTTEKVPDIAKHTIKSEWEYKNGKFCQKNIFVERNGEFDINSLNERILPFAFLEEILCGGNPSDFLAESLKGSAERLKEYLGDFIGIMPPPIFREQNQVGLIFPDGKNKYRAKYCAVTISDKKVSNIKLL